MLALQSCQRLVDMLRTPVLVRRLTQMSADTGQVATALKTVLEKASAAAQRSGKNTKVQWRLYIIFRYNRLCPTPQDLARAEPAIAWSWLATACAMFLAAHITAVASMLTTHCTIAAKSGSSQQDQAD